MNGSRRVVPGSLENSFLCYRLTGTRFGKQMPPANPLSEEQISTIKSWIEQGAEWPDALANEADRTTRQAITPFAGLYRGRVETN